MNKRALSRDMFMDFKNDDGKLRGLLERVLNDDTLSLEFRGDGEESEDVPTGSNNPGVNIYYRGGSLFFVGKKGGEIF